MAEKYFDLNDTQNVAEPIDPREVESGDYTGQDLIPVGSYLSLSRDIKQSAKKPDGTRSFEITLSGGLQDPATGKVFGLGRPLRTWVSTKQFQEEGRIGTTSTVSKYLRAVGINPKEVDSMTDALSDSASMPVMVYIGWTNRGEKQADGTYGKEFLKTRDFNQGTKDAPDFVPVVTINGQTYSARHKVGGFNRAK